MVAGAQFTLGDAVLRLTASTEGINKALGSAQRNFQKRFGNIARMGAKLSQTMKRVGIGIGIGLGFAVKGAIDFDKAMRRVNTIARLTNPEFEKLSDIVREQARLLGRDAAEAANTYYNILSAGITDPQKALEVLTESLKASVGGLVEADVAAKAITGIMNQFGKETISAAEANDTLFKLVERGVTTFEEIAVSFSDVGQIAGPLKLDLDEMASIVATLTLSTNSAARATTQVQAAITAWLKPNKEMIGGIAETIEKLKEQGIEFGKTGEDLELSVAAYEKLKEEIATLEGERLPGLIEAQKAAGKEGEKYRETITSTRKELQAKKKAMKDAKEEMETMASRMGPTILRTVGLQKAMETLADTVDRNEGALAQMLGRKEAVAAALGIIGDRAGDVADNMGAMAEKTGAAQLAADEMAKSTSEKFAKLKQDIKDVGIELGESLLPSLESLAEDLKPLVEDLGEWVKANNELVPGLVKWGAAVAVGGILAKGLLGIATVIGAIVGGLLGVGVSVGTGMVAAVIATGAAFFALGTAVDRFLLKWKPLDAAIGETFDRLVKIKDLLGGGFLDRLKGAFQLTQTLNPLVAAPRILSSVLGLASGGTVRSPLQVVGERGPELAQLPIGTQVTNATDTAALLNAARGLNVYGNIVLSGVQDPRDFWRKILAEAEAMAT